MLRHIFFALVLFFIAGVTPTNAYVTTHQEAFSVNNVGVFVIDFVFGHEKYDIMMPVHARRGIIDGINALGFEVLDKENQKGRGEAIGIVLSKVKHDENMYTAPKGTKSDFRLLVLYTYANNETPDTMRTQVTHLPFAFKDTQDLELNEHELRAYTAGIPAEQTRASIRVLRTQ